MVLYAKEIIAEGVNLSSGPQVSHMLDSTLRKSSEKNRIKEK